MNDILILPLLGYKFYASKLDDAWTALHITQNNSSALRQKFLSEIINEAMIKQISLEKLL